MSVDISALRLSRASPAPFTFGGVIFPTTGGEALTIARMGSRWMWSFVTPAISVNSDEFDAWSALLGRAEREGGLCPVVRPGRDGLDDGTPVAASLTTEGRSLPISGMAVGYVPRPGHWASVIVAGRRYLDQLDAATAPSSGASTLTLRNLIRTPIPAGAAVELAVPMVEGVLQVTGQPEWSTDDGLTTRFEFTITESK
jgi:hypothetical protein